ncbi:XrtY-associated glycosyltransferase XYAG1 [Mucilaginibacter glaciei]|uniref:Glycosyltransferase n=1 Tax=Mucilaginibacter glaciei TaxID=2772109 RepID=A0A926NPX9_9SPHI|nr:glycosyltransferase [Mucilaginibacter glaciei]MBD1392912.1 glycosyltransferase [Mucilaginibacter glaciei]
MKILHVTAAYKPAFIYGGPTMSVASLCEHLQLNGNQVEVFTTTANGREELPVTPNLQIIVDGVKVTYFKRITKDHTHFSPSLLNALRKRATEFDAIHIHAWWNLVSLLACFISLQKKVPVVLSPRGMLSNYSFGKKNTSVKALIHRLIGKSLLKRTNIHATSFNENTAVKKLGTFKSIATIPNFVQLQGKNAYPAKSRSSTFKLLFFSRIDEKKGLDILLTALKTLSIPYHLTIGGDGKSAYINQLKSLATVNNLADKITWVGFYGDNKFMLLQEHDLMILPSHDENFGNVVIESLSVGTAVLVSKNVGLANYIQSTNLGWVCERTPKAISEAIADIWGNHLKDLDRIAQVAPELVRKDFTGENLLQQYLNLYQKIISNE